MLYVWHCSPCDKLVTVSRRLADIDVPPEACDYCGRADFSGREIPPRSSTKVKQFILLGETGWHDKEYTRHRSIR